MTAMTTTVTGFPGFAPAEHRQLLADISRWLRTTGWTTHRHTGWQDPTRLVQVDWDERGLFIGSRDTVDRVWQSPRHWPAANVRQAVDILAALGILPPLFSSQYQLGRNDAAFIANVDTNPDRKCRYCGATSGLTKLPGNPLSPAPAQWACWDDCRDSAR